MEIQAQFMLKKITKSILNQLPHAKYLDVIHGECLGWVYNAYPSSKKTLIIQSGTRFYHCFTYWRYSNPTKLTHDIGKKTTSVSFEHPEDAKLFKDVIFDMENNSPQIFY